MSAGVSVKEMATLEAFARILEYPDLDFPAYAWMAAETATRVPGAREALQPLVDWAQAATLEQAEERYTSTFDLQAPCCLEVGYQLFGETYKRGVLLVKLRGALRKHGVAEGSELPDHLSVLLRLLTRLERDEDPAGLVEEAVLPAVAKMRDSFTQAHADNPYRALLDALLLVLTHDYALALPEPAARAVHLPVMESP